jgi:hypothetical protein
VFVRVLAAWLMGGRGSMQNAQTWTIITLEHTAQDLLSRLAAVLVLPDTDH